MTGHGRGESEDSNLKVTTEIHSVNRKQLDILVNVPRGFDSLEIPLKKSLLSRISRGRVTVKCYVEDLSGNMVSQTFNPEVAEKHLKDLKKFAQDHGLEKEFNVTEIARLPGIFEHSQNIIDPDEFLPVFQKSVDAACEQFLASRNLEGQHLKEALITAVKEIQSNTQKVRELAPQVQEYHRTQLQERLKKAGLEPDSVDPNRLAQEIVLIADKCDVSEELDRLESHFQKFDHLIHLNEPTGRSLDFLAQEMFREINTTGSKANDAGLSHLVVQMKTELEKFREQVQNIE